MKQFLFKGIAILVLVALIDVAVGAVSDKIFTNLPDKNSMMATIYQSLFNKKTEVLILGPSTANHNYNSMLMADSLGMDVYNSGLDGRDIIYSDVVLQSYLKRCKLKKVILDISSVQLDGSWLNRIHDTKPYYGLNDAVTNYYNTESDWQQRLKLLSSLYRYNKTLSYWIRVQIDPVNTTKGYSPLSGVDDCLEWNNEDSFSVDTAEYKHLMNIVNVCKKVNTKLILVQSPKAGTNPVFDKWISDFAKIHGITIIKENVNRYYRQHPELFKDENHLNSEGADVFSKHIVEQI